VPTVSARTQCKNCLKWKHPLEIWRLPGHGVTICPDCQDAFERSLAGMGQYLKGEVACPVCRKTQATVHRDPATGDIPMYVHAMDGTHIPICEECHHKMVRLNKDRYKDTPAAKEYGIA